MAGFKHPPGGLVLQVSAPACRCLWVMACFDASRPVRLPDTPITGSDTPGRVTPDNAPKSQKGAGEHGASMIEFAVVALLFVSVVMATVDFGFTLYDMNASSHGDRSASRAASLITYGSDTTCPTTNFQGEPGNSTGTTELKKLVCFTKQQIGIDPTRIRVRVQFESALDPHTTGSSVAGDSIVVCTQTSARSLTGMFAPLLNHRTLTSKSRARLEPTITQTLNIATGGEDPLPNHTWNSCNTLPAIT